MIRIFPILALLMFTLASSAFAEDADIAQLFTGKNVQGMMVISSLDGTITYSHKDESAATRMLPASTFKIPNTLIALEEGALADEKQVWKWDGTDRGVAAWNKDQTLESAFKSSCIWCYQELARRVGTERYNAWLTKLQYGNSQAGPQVDNFWLEGDLRISAVEHITFLKRVYRREFHFKPASYELLKKLMVIEQTPGYTLRAKTGWAGFGVPTAPQIGWYVGYVETKTDVWFFAMNMNIAKPADAGLRQKLVMEVLKVKGII